MKPRPIGWISTRSREGVDNLAPFSFFQIVCDDPPTLIIHGREDRIIPVSSSMRLFELIPNSQLHLFGKCGHWTQIEHAARFNKLLLDFFGED